MDHASPDQRTLVIVPTFNEANTIAEVAARLFAAGGEGIEMLVVDDASDDGTANIVRAIQRDNRRVHLLERSGKLGLGTAYVEGFGWALERGYDHVMEMDADLSHDPADVPRLLRGLEHADLVIGSRYVPGGAIPSWGPLRRAISKAGNLYARGWLRFAVKDSTSGFRAYRAGTLRSIDLGSVSSEGYAFQIEMTRRVHRAGGVIEEVPITFVDRTHGRSKMSRRIVLEALLSVTRWGLADLIGGRRRRAAPASPAAVPGREES